MVTKRVRSFIATSRVTKGTPIKVVLVKEDDKTWLPLISTDVDVSDLEILESYAVRFGIEEMFKDLKEVWGWGKQELRLLESNEAAATMNMLLFGMTELATWDRSHGELVDRSDCPWDDVERRPSHADRRNFLRRAIVCCFVVVWWGIPALIAYLERKDAVHREDIRALLAASREERDAFIASLKEINGQLDNVNRKIDRIETLVTTKN